MLGLCLVSSLLVDDVLEFIGDDVLEFIGDDVLEFIGDDVLEFIGDDSSLRAAAGLAVGSKPIALEQQNSTPQRRRCSD